MTTSSAQTSAHTPGPWHVCGGSHPDKVLAADSNLIADCSHPNRPPHFGEANARLIAAAPTMYSYIAKKAAEGDSDAKDIIDSI